jgi:hypothetical protein
MSRHGKVLRWSSDSEGETDKNDQAAKEKLSCPFDGLVIPETELQTSPEKPIVETAVTETAATETETAIQPVKVAKQFEAGLFIGEVTAVNIKRGRNLYTVLYEDGGGEDMNDREYKEARALYEDIKALVEKKLKVRQRLMRQKMSHCTVEARQRVVILCHLMMSC